MEALGVLVVVMVPQKKLGKAVAIMYCVFMGFGLSRYMISLNRL
jgi:hypothetical protein